MAFGRGIIASFYGPGFGLTVPLLTSARVMGLNWAALKLVRFIASRDFDSPVGVQAKRYCIIWSCGLNSSTLAQALARIAKRKMARLSSFTFFPSRVSSWMQVVISPRIAFIWPFENGVLWLAMWPARSSRVRIPLYFALGYQRSFEAFSAFDW